MDTRRLVTYLLLAIAVVAVFRWTRLTWVAVVAAAVAAVVAVWVHRSLDGREAEAEEPASEPLPELAEWVGHLQSLAQLNASIREQALPAAVVDPLEENIDVLRRLVPELNAGYVGSELTWTVNRMASDYLPRVLTPYLRLAPPARAEHEAELLDSLRGLESELDAIDQMVRNQREGEFKSKAAFLRARFLET